MSQNANGMCSSHADGATRSGVQNSERRKIGASASISMSSRTGSVSLFTVAGTLANWLPDFLVRLAELRTAFFRDMWIRFRKVKPVRASAQRAPLSGVPHSQYGGFVICLRLDGLNNRTRKQRKQSCGFSSVKFVT